MGISEGVGLSAPAMTGLSESFAASGSINDPYEANLLFSLSVDGIEVADSTDQCTVALVDDLVSSTTSTLVMESDGPNELYTHSVKLNPLEGGGIFLITPDSGGFDTVTFTLETWIKRSSPAYDPLYKMILAGKYSLNYGRHYVGLGVGSDTTIDLTLNHRSTSLATTLDANVDEWVHVAIAYDGDTENLYYWINGVAYQTEVIQAFGFNNWTTYSGNYLIGASMEYGDDGFLPANMASLRFYDVITRTPYEDFIPTY